MKNSSTATLTSTTIPYFRVLKRVEYRFSNLGKKNLIPLILNLDEHGYASLNKFGYVLNMVHKYGLINKKKNILILGS